MKINIVRLIIGLIMLSYALHCALKWNRGPWSMDPIQVLSLIVILCTSAIIIALAFEGKGGQE